MLLGYKSIDGEESMGYEKVEIDNSEDLIYLISWKVQT